MVDTGPLIQTIVIWLLLIQAKTINYNNNFSVLVVNKLNVVHLFIINLVIGERVGVCDSSW